MSAAPVWPQEATFESGLAAYRAGDLNLAENLLTALLEREPGQVEGRHVLALAQRDKGLPWPAAENLSEVLRCQPNNAEAWSNYGAVLRECGRLKEAVEALMTSTIINPDNPLSWNNLGTVFLDFGQSDKAEESFKKSLALKPDYSEALINLSRISFEAGRLGESRQLARSAIAVSPSRAEAHNRLSFFQASVGDLEGCLTSLATARKVEPENDRIASNYMLRVLGSDRRSAEDIRCLAEDWASNRSSGKPFELNRPAKIKRIGFVSGDLRRHPVGLFLCHVLEELAGQVEIFCYSTVPGRDEITERINRASTGWQCIYRKPAEDVAQSIADDGVDVLVDLSGHTSENRLDVFALKPAPMQVTWLGYSGTTGLTQMDAILVDHVLVPQGHEHVYTERVARLPGGFLCFEPPQYCPAPQSPTGPPVFGVFNNPAKYSETSFRMWAKILLAASGSRIVFKYHYSQDPVAQKHIRGLLEDFGVPKSQISFAPFLRHEEHLDFLSTVHVALDTYPYSGATTTFDCLWSNVPVVTRTGDRYASNMTASILAAVGRTSTVTQSEDDYVRSAIELASDPRELANARTGLRESLLASPLCDTPKFAVGLLETLNSLLEA